MSGGLVRAKVGNIFLFEVSLCVQYCEDSETKNKTNKSVPS